MIPHRSRTPGSTRLPRVDESVPLSRTSLGRTFFFGSCARSPKLLRCLILGLFVFVSLFSAIAAETIPPKPAGYFDDYAGVVPPATALELNEKLAQFERDTSDQVVVAVYRKMESDSSIEDYTQRVAQAWQVGQKNTRNGVVLFVFIDDHKMFIQVGYGLEGALPDITAFDITERHIKPLFRNNDYEGGLRTGVDLICKAILGEYKGTGKTRAEQSENAPAPVGVIIFLVFLAIIFIISRFNRRRGYGYSSFGGPFIGGFGGGGWGGGGSSGGGFSGFSGGGGSFGGGGAGSSW